MKLRTHHFMVSLRVDASQARSRLYIHNALKAWGGGYRPDDPFFGLQWNDIVIQSLRLPTRRK